MTKLNIEGPYVASIYADEQRYWAKKRAGETEPSTGTLSGLSSVKILEVCDGCKIFGIRTTRRGYVDVMWSTVPVVKVYPDGRVRLVMEAYCPICWAKLVWAMLREHKPYFNGKIDVDTTLWSYVTKGGDL